MSNISKEILRNYVNEQDFKRRFYMDVQEATQKYRMNEWIKIIRECRSSGQTVKSWCTENGIRISRYYYWLRKVRTVACETIPSKNAQEQIVPVDTSKLSGIISTDTAYVSPETAQADIIIRFGSVVLEVHNSASDSLIENTIRYFIFMKSVWVRRRRLTIVC